MTSNILNQITYSESLSIPLLPPANEVWGKVISLHLSVILFTREDLPHCMLGYTPQEQTQLEQTPLPRADPLRVRHPPGADTLPKADTSPQCMLGDIGNKWAVHIPLECNLVANNFYFVCVCVWFQILTQSRMFYFLQGKQDKARIICGGKGDYRCFIHYELLKLQNWIKSYIHNNCFDEIWTVACSATCDEK